MTDAAYLFRKPIHSVKHAFTLATVVGVVYHFTFKKAHKLIHQQMMYYTVTEVGGEYLTVLRSCHTEDDRRGRCVSAVEQTAGELFQFALIIPPKLNSRRLATFVPPTRVVSIV
jgi:hypothetical protein